jgi:hypothetical protein
MIYRPKRTENVEAIQFSLNEGWNDKELIEFTGLVRWCGPYGHSLCLVIPSEKISDAHKGRMYAITEGVHTFKGAEGNFESSTFAGSFFFKIEDNDYVVKGSDGKIIVMSDEAFERLYEPLS